MIVKEYTVDSTTKQFIKDNLNDLYNIDNIDESLEPLTEKTLFKVYENNELITSALISKPNKKYYLSLLEKYIEIDNTEISYTELYEECYKDWIYLDCIKSFKEGLGGASFLIDYIFKKYGAFWLYSDIEAENFWEYKKLDYLGNYCFFKDKQ